MTQENLESLANLEENLNEYGKSLATLPHVIQYNKRDLPDAMSLEELEQMLNASQGALTYEAVANTGQGRVPDAEGARVVRCSRTSCRSAVSRRPVQRRWPKLACSRLRGWRKPACDAGSRARADGRAAGSGPGADGGAARCRRASSRRLRLRPWGRPGFQAPAPISMPVQQPQAPAQMPAARARRRRPGTCRPKCRWRQAPHGRPAAAVVPNAAPMHQAAPTAAARLPPHRRRCQTGSASRPSEH